MGVPKDSHEVAVFAVQAPYNTHLIARIHFICHYRLADGVPRCVFTSHKIEIENRVDITNLKCKSPIILKPVNPNVPTLVI